MIEVLKLCITVLAMCEAGLGKPAVRKARVLNTDVRRFYFYPSKEFLNILIHINVTENLYCKFNYDNQSETLFVSNL